MGVTIYPVINIDADWTESKTDGKILAKAMHHLEKVAKMKKVKTLYQFFSMDREQFICDVLGGDADDPESFEESKVRGETWFEPQEGLETINGLIDYLYGKPNEIENPLGVIDDLMEFRNILEKARDKGLKWYLAQYV